MINIPGYKVERALGRGGMATVYLAIQESFEREVALKVMSPSLSEDPKFSERFLREAKIVSRLVHPNIVTVYDVGVQNGHHFLSMEYIPGKDLKSKRRFMTAKQCIRVIKEVAGALDYASKKGYVHRDVKPENIMLHEEDGRAILMDFGIACMEDTASGMTQTGTAIGTPHYMSPEQAKGKQVDSRSDIYSLGVVFFLCLTGHVPYDADSAVAVGIKHVSEPVPRLPKYLLILQPIIDKVLAKNPDERYQSGQELIAAIGTINDEDLETIDILATKKTIARIDTKDTEAPTIVSGNVKSIPGVVDKTPRAASTARNQAAQNTGPNPKVAGQAAPKAVNKNAPQKKTAVAGSAKRQVTATTSPIHASKGAATRVVGVTEVLSVDEDDRRERGLDNPFGKTSRRLWPWLLVAGVGGAMAGGYYFKEQLPPQLQTVVEQVERQVVQLKNEVFDSSKDTGAQRVENNSALANPLLPNNAAPVANRTVDPNEVTDNTANGSGPSVATSVAIEQNSAIEDSADSVVVDDGSLPEQSSGGQSPIKERSLSERLYDDDELGVVPELAQNYRDILARDAQNKNAEMGLENIKLYHYNKIRDALRSRDTDSATLYMESLQTGFADIADNETYQNLTQRIDKALSAKTLIDQGNNYLANNELTLPGGANALESFQGALRVDPGNPLAQEGVEKVVGRLVELAQQEYELGNYARSIQHAKNGLALDADNEALLQVQGDAEQQQRRQNRIEEVLLNAKRAVAAGRLVSPPGDNGYEYYQQAQTLGATTAARNGIAEIEREVVQQVTGNINTNNFDQANLLLLEAREKFVGSERLLNLQVVLEEAIEADHIARQPKILNILVSNQLPRSIVEEQKNPLSLGRTVHIGFEYKNFVGDTSVVQAILYNGTRQLAQTPVIVPGAEGITFFKIDQPVDGFSEGDYNIDLLLNENRLGTLAFQVDRTVAVEQN